MTTPPAPVVPDATGHFGRFGGRFVPEALVAALDELTAAFTRPRPTPSSSAELAALLRDYTGRPSPLTDVPKFGEHAGGAPDPAQARGPQPHRLAQDQQRAGPGAADPAHRQEAGDRRDRRRPARRRDRHRRRAARPGLRGLHGRGGHPPPGAQRRPDAAARRRGRARHHRLAHPQGRDQRGHARLGDQRRHHQLRLRHRRRAAPVPADGARVPAGHRRRGPRAGARALRAGCPTPSRPASAAAPTRSASSPPSCPTTACGWSAWRPAATASTPAGTRRPITGGTPGVLHGARSYLLQDDNGQIVESHSISRRPRLPGRRPRALLPARHRPRRVPADHRRAGDGGVLAAVPAPRASSRRSSRRTRWPARWTSAVNSARTRSSWSTSPAVATRTSRPRRASSGWTTGDGSIAGALAPTERDRPGDRQRRGSRGRGGCHE